MIESQLYSLLVYQGKMMVKRLRKFKPYIALILCLGAYRTGSAADREDRNAAGLIERVLPGVRDAFLKKPSFNQELQTEILAMQAEDQEGEIDGCIDASPIRARHNQRLKEMIAEFGWPGLALVGLKGSVGMCRLVQYQDTDLEFQQMCLSLLKNAVEKRDAPYREYAYLFDRVRINEGGLQVYETQGTQKGEEFSLYPVEEIKNLPMR